MYYDQSQGILGFGSSSRFSDSPVGHEITDRSLDSFVVGFDFGRDNGSEGAGEVHWGGVDQTAMGENSCDFPRCFSLVYCRFDSADCASNRFPFAAPGWKLEIQATWESGRWSSSP